MKKRGLSTIVSTLLILLLVFVAVAILWVVVRNVIQSGTEQVSLGKFTLDLKIDQVSVDETNNQVSVGIRRDQGEGEFVGIKIIVSDGENSEIYNQNGSLKVYEKKSFKFYLNDLNVSNINMIQIVPIFRLSSGKEVSGDVKDTWEKSVSGFSSKEEIQLPSENETGQECTTATEDTDCTTDYYSGNFCSGEDIYRNYYDFSCNASNKCSYEIVPSLVQDCSLTDAVCQSSQCVVVQEQENETEQCTGDSTQSCTITNGAGQKTRTCTDGQWSDYGTCTVVSCNSGYEISGNSCVASEENPPATGNAESSYLAGVPLIHAQTFLIPENAVVGDTVGDLNKMWIGPSQSVSFSLTNNDGGRFSINSAGRISVASANFDYDSQSQRQITVRATSSGKYNDAVITIKLSKEEKTVFIDPSWNGCQDGTRACPYKSWQSGSGVSTSRTTQSGYAYLQKRGTVSYQNFNVMASGTPTEHTVIGAYGSGDRPDVAYYCASGSTAQAIFLGWGSAHDASEAANYLDIYSYSVHGCNGIRSSYGNIYVSLRDLELYDNENNGAIYFWHDLRDTEGTGLEGNENARDQNILIEDVVTHDNPVHGIKAHPGKMIIRNILAYNNEGNHGLSLGGRNHEVSYIRAYNNNAAGLEIGSSNTNVHHILSYDNYYGIILNEAAFDITLKDSVSRDNYAQGVRIFATKDSYGNIKSCPDNVLVEGVRSYGNVYSGINLVGKCEDVTLRDNYIQDNDEGIGFYSYSGDGSPDNVDILNNEILDNANDGVNVETGNDVLISGNTFCGNSGDNIYVSGSATNVQQTSNTACN